jgi:2-polyprenyl-3-methyl-5-hydroxy-6-metoxy-1,4-benzoquinol methylase
MMLEGHLVKMETRECPVCLETSEAVILTGTDRLHGLPGTFTVVRCQKCGLMRTNPRPTIETIGFYYPDNYRPYVDTQVQASTSRSSKYRLKTFLRQLIDPLSEVIPPISPGRMLEVGSASGKFLHKMAGQGWEVVGIEPNRSAAEAAAKLDFKVHVGTLESAPSPEYQFDLIVGWMVLEHLHEPVLSLQKLAQWTRTGGWIALSVPNAGSIEFSIFKGAWFALQVPTHLYHYTTITITDILDKGGWHQTKIMHQRSLSNMVASLGYLLQDHHILSGLGKLLVEISPAWYVHIVLYPLALFLSLVGQTGRMTIWAQKK